jgi:hypothetical protein
MLSLGKKIKFIKIKYLIFLKKNFFIFYLISILVSGLFKFIKIFFNKKSNIKYSHNLDNINNYEYRVTSQNNEDGIIDFIFSKINLKKINFVEIGFDFYESNSLNFFKKSKKGLMIDGSFEKCFILKNIIKVFYYSNNINVLNSLINKENINQIINKHFLNENIDFLSIDVDGIDYYLLEEINFSPKLICIEYNHWYGPNRSVTIPYDRHFVWNSDYYSGASLLALTKLANKKNYHLIAIDSSCTNAFFIHNDYKNKFDILDPVINFKYPLKYPKNDYSLANKFFENKKILEIE